MRHRNHRFQLGVKKEHRQALIANLAAALFRHGRIQTTLTKAKALRPFAERIITLAKKAQNASPERALHYRRLAIARVRDKDAIATLFNERADMFSERAGGYTRIYKLQQRRGDAAEMAVIMLVEKEDEGYEKQGRSSKRQPQPAAAAAPAAVAEAPAAAESAPVSEEAAAPEATAESSSEETRQ